MQLKNVNLNVGKAAGIIAVFSLLSKILGLARDAVFSNKFGTDQVIDAYFAAFRIPDFVFNLLILGTFSVAFIPVFSEYLIKDKKKAHELASSIINSTVLIILVLTLLAYIFIDPLTSLIAPGFDGEVRELTKTFTKIFLLSPLFLTLSSILSSVLNSYKRFALVSAAPVIYNLSIIFGAVFLYPRFGNLGLAYGVVLGALLHFAIQIPGLRHLGFSYSLSLNRREPGFKKFWWLYWPRIFSMGTNQITLLIATFFGSFLGPGALAAFYYANNLQSVFLSVFAISFALAIFPLLSDLYNQRNEHEFKDVLAKTTSQILFFIFPLSMLMLVLRAQIVRLVLGIGSGTSFTFEDTRLVSLTLGLFVVSLFAQALIPLYTRAFYARQNTMIPMVIGFFTIILNVVATYFLVHRFGLPGLAISFSLTSIINLIILVMELHRKIGQFHDEYLVISSLKIIIGSLIASVATYASLYAIAPYVNMQTYWGVLIQAVGSGIIGVTVYLISGWILKMEESHNIIKLLKAVVSRTTKTFSLITNLWS